MQHGIKLNPHSRRNGRPNDNLKQHKHYDYNSAARVGSSPLTGVGRLIIASDELSAKREPEGEDASFMCSDLVFRAYEMAGAPLTKKPAHCVSPGMLFHTDRLECMGEMTYKRS